MKILILLIFIFYTASAFAQAATCERLFDPSHPLNDIDSVISDLYSLKLHVLTSDTPQLSRILFKNSYSQLSKILGKQELDRRLRDVKKEKTKNTVQTTHRKVLDKIDAEISESLLLGEFLNKAGLNYDDIYSHTARTMIAAVLRGRLDIIKILLNKNIDINAQNENGNTPLHSAIYYSNNAIIDFLLEHGADPNVTNEKGENTLHVAAKKSDPALITKLIEFGANAYATDEHGETPLMTALRSNQNAVLSSFLENKINPNIQDRFGLTVFHWAIALNSENAVNILLESSADINVLDKSNNTPLHIAAFNYTSIDIIKSLIQHKVDIHAKNSSDLTALEVAEDKKRDDIAEYLRTLEEQK